MSEKIKLNENNHLAIAPGSRTSGSCYVVGKEGFSEGKYSWTMNCNLRGLRHDQFLGIVCRLIRQFFFIFYFFSKGIATERLQKFEGLHCEGECLHTGTMRIWNSVSLNSVVPVVILKIRDRV